MRADVEKIKTEDKRNGKLLFNIRGTIRIGNHLDKLLLISPVISRISIHKNEIVISISKLDNILSRIVFTNYYNKIGQLKINDLPKEIHLKANEILSYDINKKFLGLSFQYRVRLIHKNKKIPSFLEFWIDNKSYAENLINYLEKFGKKKLFVRVKKR